MKPSSSTPCFAQGQALRNQQGASLVEFALVLVVFLALVFGLADVARLVFNHSVLQAAAQDGARYGIIHPGDVAGIESTVQGRLVGMEPERTQITVTTSGASVTVQVEYSFEFVIPMVANLVGADQIPLRSSARMTR